MSSPVITGKRSGPVRHLVLVLGDQLSLENPALTGFDSGQDAVLMIEATAEGAHVWSHKARIALFLSAMRHHCADLHERGWRIHFPAWPKAVHATCLPCWPMPSARTGRNG